MAKDKKKLENQVDQAVTTLEDYPPGMLPDGKLDIVQEGDPPFRPTIVDDDGNEVEQGAGEGDDED